MTVLPGSLAAFWDFAAFALVALVLPGVGLQRALRLPLDPALVLPLGYAWCAAAHGLSLVAGRPALFPVLVGAAGLAGLLPRGPWALAPGPSLRGALPPALGLVALLAVAQYRFATTDADGSVRLDPVEAIDTCLHVGIVWELSQGYPPQVPGFAGRTLAYPHLGQDLVRSAAVRWASVHPYDLLQRYDMTLAGLALVLALRALVRALGGGPWAVALAGWTPILGDFSFLFGGFAGADWWIDLLSTNLLLHLAYGNALVLALALLCGALVAWRRSEDAPGGGWGIVAGALAAGIPFFKPFLALPFTAGLAVAALRRQRGALGLATWCLAAQGWLLLSPSPSSLVTRLEPLVQPLRTAESLRWLPLGGAALAGFTAAWLFAGLGLRWLGVPRLLGAARRGAGPDQALAVTVLASALLGLALRLTFQGEEADYNVGYYFLVQAGALLWVFAALAAPRPARLAGRVAWLAVLAALALPAPVQFAWKKAGAAPLRVPGPVVRAAVALQGHSRPGDVVLEAPNSRFPPAALVLGARRVAFTRFLGYMVQFAPADQIARRRADVEDFFETGDPARATEIAGRLGARYVLSFGTRQLRFDPRGHFVPVYAEGNVTLLRQVDAAAGEAPGNGGP